MGSYTEALIHFLIPQVVAGLIGGFIGAWINAKVDEFGLRLTLLFGLGGVIAAGAVSEYMYYEQDLYYLLVHCILGVVTGIFASSGIDTLKFNAPLMTKNLVEGVGSSLLDRVLTFLKLK